MPRMPTPSPVPHGKYKVRSRGLPSLRCRAARLLRTRSGVIQPITPTLATVWPSLMAATAVSAEQNLFIGYSLERLDFHAEFPERRLGRFILAIFRKDAVCQHVAGFRAAVDQRRKKTFCAGDSGARKRCETLCQSNGLCFDAGLRHQIIGEFEIECLGAADRLAGPDQAPRGNGPYPRAQ